jgi:hypothetical protein
VQYHPESILSEYGYRQVELFLSKVGEEYGIAYIHFQLSSSDNYILFSQYSPTFDKNNSTCR